MGALALGAAGVDLYGCGRFGVQAALLALLVSAVPLLIVIPTFIWLDRFEAEPTRYLVAAFPLGPWRPPSSRATINTSAMAVIQATVGERRGARDRGARRALRRGRQGVFVLCVWWFLRREFDGLIDGMVYAGVVAAGFAFTENIQYWPRLGMTGA